MPKITMSIRTEPELKAKLEYMIKGSEFSLADAIKTALFQYIEKYEKENGKIPQNIVESRTAEILKGRKL
jgi:predicted transcriptional regulator